MPLAIAAIAALMLLAWGGVEVNDAVHAYPGQFLMGVVAFLVISVAFAAAKFRKANQRVPLAPAVPLLPPAIQAKPELPVLKASPTLRAVASPEQEPEALPCEGPGCRHKVDDDPWTASVQGDEAVHVFCSHPCAERWKSLRGAPSR